MNRSGPIQRNTELKRGSGPARSSGLARGGPLARGAPLERGEPMNRTPMKRKPADNNLSGDEWAEVFRLLLVRSGGRCEGGTPWCVAPAGYVEGMPRGQVSIQHRRARGTGGTALAETHTLANLLLLCGTGTSRACHGWVENKERAAAEKRGLWVRHEYEDGVLVPVDRYPLVLPSGRRVFLHPTEPRYIEHPLHDTEPAMLAG